MSAVLAGPDPARACGGLFCNPAAPVDQAGEEIAFVPHGDGTITVLVRIRYEGPAEKFAWLLPMPGVPEIGLSSNVAFDRLNARSAPSYSLTTVVEGECKHDEDAGFFGDCSICQSLGEEETITTAGGSAGPVSVLDEGSVGPYDYTVIAVDQALDHPEIAAVAWLVEHGYDVTRVGPALLRPYLADGLNLVAFKLTKNAWASAGAIRPVTLTYRASRPSIPIRLTAVAARDDMPIVVWVLGDARAVSLNYRHVLLNESMIDWRSFDRPRYDALVSDAVDEAGGRAFVTELAGPTTLLEDAIFLERDAWRTFEATTYASGIDAIMAAAALFRSWDGFREAIAEAVTLPPEVTLDAFGLDPQSYRDVAQVDAERLRDALYKLVVRPVTRTQELLVESTHVTRLFTTLSADEMTEDPVFDWNSGLDDVDNVHLAERVIECDPSRYEWEAPWRVVLAEGLRIRGVGAEQGWPVCSLPASLRVTQLGTQGSGEVLLDNRDAIAESLDAPAATSTCASGGGAGTAAAGDATDGGGPRDGGGVDAGNLDAGDRTRTRTSPAAAADSGCAVASPGQARGSSGAAFALLVAVARRRRRPWAR